MVGCVCNILEVMRGAGGVSMKLGEERDWWGCYLRVS